MRPSRLLAAAGAAALATLAASPSLAMTGECFWSHLSPATRATFLSNYGQLGAEALDRVKVSADEYGAMDSACGAAGVDPAIKDRLLGADVIEHGSAAFLEGSLRWDNDAIETAWSRLTQDDLDSLHDQAREAIRGRASDDEDVTVQARRFLGDMVVTNPQVLDQARAYVTSRAMREAIEQTTGSSNAAAS